MIHPDQAQVLLDRGARAQRILEDTAFLEFVDDATEQNLAQMVACRPGERDRDARDHAHLMQYALTEIIATLRGHVDTADNLKRALELGAEEDNDE